MLKRFVKNWGLNFNRSNSIFAISFLFVITLSSQFALAEIEVIASSDPNIKIGITLPDNTSLNIPENVTINLLKTPENETYTLKGPFKGTLEDYTKRKKCTIIQRILGRCKFDGDSSDTGGITGGTRGIKQQNNQEK